MTGRRVRAFVLALAIALPVVTLPTSAAGATTFMAQGASAFTGRVHYHGSGLSLVGACGQNGWIYTATAEVAFHVDVALVAYVGPITVTAVGTPWECENLWWPPVSWGWLNLSFSGTGPTGSTISCTAGSDYSREGNFVGWSAFEEEAATCTVNGYTSRVDMGFSFNFLLDDAAVTSIKDAEAPGELNTSGDCPYECT